jgi:hypothetical protein
MPEGEIALKGAKPVGAKLVSAMATVRPIAAPFPATALQRIGRRVLIVREKRSVTASTCTEPGSK